MMLISDTSPTYVPPGKYNYIYYYLLMRDGNGNTVAYMKPDGPLVVNDSLAFVKAIAELYTPKRKRRKRINYGVIGGPSPDSNIFFLQNNGVQSVDTIKKKH